MLDLTGFRQFIILKYRSSSNASLPDGHGVLYKERRGVKKPLCMRTEGLGQFYWRDRLGIEPSGDATRLPDGFEDHGKHQLRIRPQDLNSDPHYSLRAVFLQAIFDFGSV